MTQHSQFHTAWQYPEKAPFFSIPNSLRGVGPYGPYGPEAEFTPNVAKVGGLQSKTHTETYKIRCVIPQSGGVKVEIVVGYFDPLTTQDLKFSGFPDVLGRSSKSEAKRVNNMAKSTPPF